MSEDFSSKNSPVKSNPAEDTAKTKDRKPVMKKATETAKKGAAKVTNTAKRVTADAAKLGAAYMKLPVPSSLSWLYGIGFKIGILLVLKSFIILRYQYSNLSGGGIFVLISQCFMAILMIANGILLQSPLNLHDPKKIFRYNLLYIIAAIPAIIAEILCETENWKFFVHPTSNFFKNLLIGIKELQLDLLFIDRDLCIFLVVLMFIITLIYMFGQFGWKSIFGLTNPSDYADIPELNVAPHEKIQTSETAVARAVSVERTAVSAVSSDTDDNAGAITPSESEERAMVIDPLKNDGISVDIDPSEDLNRSVASSALPVSKKSHRPEIFMRVAIVLAIAGAIIIGITQVPKLYHLGKTQLEYSSKELCSKREDGLVFYLKSKGITNITIKAVSSSTRKDGNVQSISINGIGSFDAQQWFSKNSKVEIECQKDYGPLDDSVTVKLGETLALKYPPVSYSKHKWESADTSIVTVDSSGLLKPVSEGKTTVTLYLDNTVYTITVTVKEKGGIWPFN